jgi:anthranilate synthase component 2
MKLLMIDNYDSFTYNIVQYFGELGAEVEVFRNDEITVEGHCASAPVPTGWWSRPGPCSPAEAGISVAAIQHFAWASADPGCVPGAPEHWRGTGRQDRPGASS